MTDFLSFFTEEDEKAETLMDDDIKSLVSEATEQVSRSLIKNFSFNYFFIFQNLIFPFSTNFSGTGIGQSGEETISQKNDCRFHTI